MKYLILLLLFGSISAQDSLSLKLNIVEKGKYIVYKDSKVIFEFNKMVKASAKAMEIKALNPKSDVWVQQPILLAKSRLKLPKAKIDVIRFEGSKRMILNKPKKNFEFGNKCGNLVKGLGIVSLRDFEFNDIPVILRNAQWEVKGILTNKGRQISAIDALVKKLIVLKCSESSIKLTKQ